MDRARALLAQATALVTSLEEMATYNLSQKSTAAPSRESTLNPKLKEFNLTTKQSFGAGVPIIRETMDPAQAEAEHQEQPEQPDSDQDMLEGPDEIPGVDNLILWRRDLGAGLHMVYLSMPASLDYDGMRKAAKKALGRERQQIDMRMNMGTDRRVVV
jgi:hypothetical protein